ncbi:phage portal protein [Cuneatibacter caecimuris]|uniref:SPP1 family phage portal protein n=1 Tax=Cuneatibacter caecimuris TaxID=1796618 RepID=A0A4Q7PPV6_9FIRM|nr:phage portal protein [Cuneatibacter caecimuris]RZT02913.1 SPP1 family phage portal protein [Cuneatibacter caecimuris]
MYKFMMPAESWDELSPNKRAIRNLICKHRIIAMRLANNKKYYEGAHKILDEENRKNKLVCNHAKDIADTASSYFIGNPVSYKGPEDIKILTDALEQAGADETDGDNGLDLSIYGLAFEYCYVKQNETELTVKNLSAENTFMVYDDSIEENELFAVYYSVRKDDARNTKVTFAATVLTANYRYVLNIQDIDGPQALLEEPEAHYMGEVPIIAYQNNKLGIGDYELQIPLIDAYNALMSDRITDKEQFIDAILALYGFMLGDDDGKDSDGRTAAQRLKEDRIMDGLPEDARAEYITRTFDESGVEILRKAIEQDIHKFSHIPCMSDENFGGNVSGVAMEFKLLGMENITKIKTRYYKKGLRKRLRIFAYFLSMKGIVVDVAGITPTFTRALPKNLLEISQIIANLWGKVSRKTLLSQIPFVDDVDAELEAVEKETEEAVKQQQAMFGLGSNPPPDDEDDDVDE